MADLSKEPQIPVLDGRLSLCAELCREGVRVADIGTDHAYLPVYLVLVGKAVSAIAADINPHPLEKGRSTIEKYKAAKKVETRLCPGLERIRAEEAEDIVIAGMGGETIAEIISKAPWLKAEGKRLILQPMTKAEKLLEYLFKEGFEIEAQRTCRDGSKVYTVMAVSYQGGGLPHSEVDCYTGILSPEGSDTDRDYLLAQVKYLRKKARASQHFDVIADCIEERLKNL